MIGESILAASSPSCVNFLCAWIFFSLVGPFKPITPTCHLGSFATEQYTNLSPGQTYLQLADVELKQENVMSSTCRVHTERDCCCLPIFLVYDGHTLSSCEQKL